MVEQTKEMVRGSCRRHHSFLLDYEICAKLQWRVVERARERSSFCYARACASQPRVLHLFHHLQSRRAKEQKLTVILRHATQTHS